MVNSLRKELTCLGFFCWKCEILAIKFFNSFSASSIGVCTDFVSVALGYALYVHICIVDINSTCIYFMVLFPSSGLIPITWIVEFPDRGEKSLLWESLAFRNASVQPGVWCWQQPTAPHQVKKVNPCRMSPQGVPHRAWTTNKCHSRSFKCIIDMHSCTRG